MSIPKHSVEQTYDYEVFRHVYSHDIPSETLTFDLVDGGTFKANKSDVFNAFCLMTSEDFLLLTTEINDRESANEEMHELYARIADGDTELNTIYEYGRVCRVYARHDTTVRMVRDQIIDKVGWESWVHSLRIYESMTGTHREWIS